MESILIIEDDLGFQQLLEGILCGEGYRADSCRTAGEAIARGIAREYGLVISALNLPNSDGVAVLRWFREHCPETPVLMTTAFGTVHTAVEALKLGAADYLGKPLSSPDELRLRVQRILSARQTLRRCRLLEAEEQEHFPHCLIANHPAMLRLLEKARKAAPSNTPVLIRGECGTGKQTTARFIHGNSRRAAGIFARVNCALPPARLDEELFGREKGSLAASGPHPGRLSMAHGGTLFLDEIGELDESMQDRLLCALRENAFERTGSTRRIAVDVRIIAASSRNLEKQAATGFFRQDLYSLLAAFPLDIPPLRDRASDIPALAGHFLSRATPPGKAAPSLSAGAVTTLMEYPWPGNVRELENMMGRAAILCQDSVHAGDLPVRVQGAARPAGLKDIKRTAILDALAAHRGNRTRAARQLGISLRTLQYRLKEYGVTGRLPAPAGPT